MTTIMIFISVAIAPVIQVGCKYAKELMTLPMLHTVEINLVDIMQQGILDITFEHSNDKQARLDAFQDLFAM